MKSEQIRQIMPNQRSKKTKKSEQIEQIMSNQRSKNQKQY